MKYYPVISTKPELAAIEIAPPFRVMIPYHRFKKDAKLVRGLIDRQFEVIVDAFSTTDMPIDINEYCRFIIDCGVQIFTDVSTYGSPTSEAGFMYNKYSLHPMPIFGNSNWDDINYHQHIGLAPWIDYNKAWSLILGQEVHGFAINSPEIMAAYPWYSVSGQGHKSYRRLGVQRMLWNGMTWIDMNVVEYEAYLHKIGYSEMTPHNARILYDFHGLDSYKKYAAHLTELHKLKAFSYLTAQLKLGI